MYTLTTMAKAIFLEGTDGSGKSTQFQLLKAFLEQRGETVLALREPGGTPYYEALREFHLNAPHTHPAISDALLTAAGRAANIIATKQALAGDSWVITDRSYLSSYVYQSVQGVPLEAIKSINTYALDGFTYDFKIVLDTPVEVAAQRVNDSGAKKDYWESQGADFFTKVRQTYLELAKTENCTVIDASGSVEAIHQEILKVLAVS